MKVVLLAGGFGTRISEESQYKPKPMVEIGGMPILWHIMKHYSSYGFNEFIICAGYKQQYIKEWFANYFIHTSDITFDFTKGNEIIAHQQHCEPWKVTIVDTGLHTMTGGRLKRVKDFIDSETFLMTYGDGVSDVDLAALLQAHENSGSLVTMTAIQVESRYGCLDIVEGDKVESFREKSQSDGSWINAGFMAIDKKALDYVLDDSEMFERAPMEKIAADGMLSCYKHNGFWQCMDTLRDKQKLEGLWESGDAPWKTW